MTRELFVEESGPANLKAIFEDNGRVGYAYILIDGEIKGDVWLYNHGAAPTLPEWENPELAPFKNPLEFAITFSAPPSRETDIAIKWERQSDASVKALVYIRGKLLGVLRVGAKPGWAKLAKKDGPLAKVLP
jgi:hypothetical protein